MGGKTTHVFGALDDTPHVPDTLILSEGPNGSGITRSVTSLTMPACFVLFNPSTGERYDIAVHVREYNLDDYMFHHIVATLTDGTIQQYPELREWQKLCFYHYDCIAKKCVGYNEVHRHKV